MMDAGQSAVRLADSSYFGDTVVLGTPTLSKTLETRTSSKLRLEKPSAYLMTFSPVYSCYVGDSGRVRRLGHDLRECTGSGATER